MTTTTSNPIRQSDPLVDQLMEFSGKDSFEDDDYGGENERYEAWDANEACNTSTRMSISAATGRLTLENVQPCDSGEYTCRVELPKRSTLSPSRPIVGQDSGRLLVQDKLRTDEGGAGIVPEQVRDEQEISSLWILHENGISVYKIQDGDGQDMELVREINGHSSISAEVDGNWNQLTLCGGLNSEQAVICEWSDNAVSFDGGNSRQKSNNNKQQARKYVYVGQPNLNRVVVFDSFKFEIVAIINTEPQPRKLHLYEPNKIHLSKWVKRRLSPIGNARWESAIGTRAHPPESTPQESRLYSSSSSFNSLNLVGGPVANTMGATTNSNVNETTTTIGGGRAKRAATSGAEASPLIQHDIWLLCYGQPLVSLDPQSSGIHNHRQPSGYGNAAEQSANSSSSEPRLDDDDDKLQAPDSIKPFEPRLTTGVAFPPFAWPSSIWPPSSGGANSGAASSGNNKEAELRNRKSVHIIQSTFLPSSSRWPLNDGSIHRHSGPGQEAGNSTVVGEFKQASVISTHHIYPGSVGASRAAAAAANHFHHFGGTGPSSHLQRMSFFAAGRRPRYDLIQDLFVPQKPYSMEKMSEFKIHYAYVTHYDERRLFRISMDNYRYDREIDLQDCDPIHMLTTAQGLIVIQCRAPISHSLIGQLVLDQLTASRIEFNADIRAQESYLSPDNRYLVSIFHNPVSSSAADTASKDVANSGSGSGKGQRPGESLSLEKNGNQNISSYDQLHGEEGQTHQQPRHSSSIVYVQTVTVDGLRLQYEIKTLFEISQCSFVWKDGYYAAIFVTTNRKDQQSEILSLRLLDSRLELMARVPGLVSGARHKEQLIVSPELRLAALSTNQGTFVIDLEENRVSESLRRHQSPPTLLWV